MILVSRNILFKSKKGDKYPYLLSKIFLIFLAGVNFFGNSILRLSNIPSDTSLDLIFFGILLSTPRLS